MTVLPVLAGLDPAIQRKVRAERTLLWMRGLSPRMTIEPRARGR